MSEDQASSMINLTIYIRLLDEGTTAYRPVLARSFGNGIFQITSERDEIWEFETGSMVIGEPQKLNQGEDTVIVAVGRCFHHGIGVN